jgi:hypothetical protein
MAPGMIEGARPILSFRRPTLPKTFMQMAKEAMAQVPGIKSEEAYKRMKADPKTVVVGCSRCSGHD